MKDNNIIFDSTYANINVFIEKNNSVSALIDLSLYISGSFMDTPPTELQKEFIGEFFGHHEWAEFINYSKKPKTFFKQIPSFDLPTIRGILTHELLKLIKYGDKPISKSEKRLKEEKKKLKKELKTAIKNSYFDGVFDKCDGWCNISDVLQEHKLITLK